MGEDVQGVLGELGLGNGRHSARGILPWKTPDGTVDDDGEVLSWAVKPQVKSINGTAYEFYTIATFAKALERKPVTIRLWESEKRIPDSPFRSSTPNGNRLVGKKPAGRRLWVKQQILQAVKLAHEHGVIFNNTPPSKAYAQALAEAYYVIYQQVSNGEPIS